jgi:hypothetical protein
MIRKTREGRSQIVAAGSKRCCRAVETRFLAALCMCGNVAAAARSVGFTEGCIWQRRRKYPAFALALEEVLEEAEIRIEYRLAAMGSDLAASRLDSSEAVRRGAGEAAEAGAKEGPSVEGLPDPLARATRELAFDADLAFRFLKWREAKRQGRQPRQGRAAAKLWTFEESTEPLDKKVKAVGARHEKEQLAKGWVKDENGYLIPPGWVRAAPGAGGGAGAEEGGDGTAGGGEGA